MLTSHRRAAQVSSAALELFAYGQREAASRGLLLVDTKYEFGKAADGSILLIDEVRPWLRAYPRAGCSAGGHEI